MSTTTTSIRLNTKVKKEAQKLSEELGTNLSTITNIMLSQFVRRQGLDISLRDEDGFTPEARTQILHDWKDPKNTVTGSYRTAQELKSGLNNLKKKK